MTELFRLAKNKDQKIFPNLYEQVKDKMHSNGIDIWYRRYPYCEFYKYIKEKSLYVLEINGEVAGAFRLSRFDSDEKFFEWANKNSEAIYFSKMAILPKFNGMGYGKKIINFIEEYAKQNKIKYIRLTVYAKNIPAIKLYEKCGFKKVEGTAKLTKNSEQFLYGYEKEM